MEAREGEAKGKARPSDLIIPKVGDVEEAVPNSSEVGSLTSVLDTDAPTVGVNQTPPSESQLQRIENELQNTTSTAPSSARRNLRRRNTDVTAGSSGGGEASPPKRVKAAESLKHPKTATKEGAIEQGDVVMSPAAVNIELAVHMQGRDDLFCPGAPECLLAAETHQDPEKPIDLDLGHYVKFSEPKELKALERKCFFSTPPHFIRLQELFKSGPPLTRIWSLSSLERITQGRIMNNFEDNYRFIAPTYRIRLRDSDPPRPQGYPVNTLVIKHPTIGMDPGNTRWLRFIVIQKPLWNGDESAILKFKVLKVTRSDDLQFVEVSVWEEEFSGSVLDANALSQENIEPVMFSPTGGLLPLLAASQARDLQIKPEQPEPSQLTEERHHTTEVSAVATELVPGEEVTPTLEEPQENGNDAAAAVVPPSEKTGCGASEESAVDLPVEEDGAAPVQKVPLKEEGPPKETQESEEEECIIISSDEEDDHSTPKQRPATKAAPGGAGSPKARNEVLCFEGVDNMKVTITPQDIGCLEFFKLFNDAMISFWIAVIKTEFLSARDLERTFIYDTFFYDKLTQKLDKQITGSSQLTRSERRHDLVKRRTKDVDIFEKDFLIIPIHASKIHWSVAFVCFPGLQGFCDFDTLEPLPEYEPATKQIIGTEINSEAANLDLNRDQSRSQSTTPSCRIAAEAPKDSDETNNGPHHSSSEVSQDKETPTSEAEKEKSDSERPPCTGPVRKHVKRPCILVFDSLRGLTNPKVYSTLRKYLSVEYKVKRNEERIFNKDSMPGCTPKVPQQPNKKDCGPFMLQYIEAFFSRPIDTFDLSLLNLEDWFPLLEALNKRKQIYDFIRRETEESASRIPKLDLENIPEKLYDKKFRSLVEGLGEVNVVDEDYPDTDDEDGDV